MEQLVETVDWHGGSAVVPVAVEVGHEENEENEENEANEASEVAVVAGQRGVSGRPLMRPVLDPRSHEKILERVHQNALMFATGPGCPRTAKDLEERRECRWQLERRRWSCCAAARWPMEMLRLDGPGRSD